MHRDSPAARGITLRRIGIGVSLAFTAKGLVTMGLIVLAALAGLDFF